MKKKKSKLQISCEKAEAAMKMVNRFMVLIPSIVTGGGYVISIQWDNFHHQVVLPNILVETIKSNNAS